MKKSIAFVLYALSFAPALYCAANNPVVKTVPTEPTEAFLYLQLRGLERSFANNAPQVYQATSDTYEAIVKDIQKAFDCFNTLGFEIPATTDLEADFRAILKARIPAVMDTAYQIFSGTGRMQHSRNEILKDPALRKVLTLAFMARKDKLKKTLFERHLVLKTPKGVDFTYIAHRVKQAQIVVLEALHKARTEKMTTISLTGGINEKFEKEWETFKSPLNDEDCAKIILETFATLA